jgi:hypothetical protein
MSSLSSNSIQGNKEDFSFLIFLASFSLLWDERLRWKTYYGGSNMSEVRGRKDRPCLGTYMERLNQRGRWEEASCQNRNNEILNFLFWLGFVFDILDSSVNSLMSSKVTTEQEVRL